MADKDKATAQDAAQPVSLLEALNAAGPEQLQEIDAQIAETQALLDSLQQVQRILRKRLQVEPPPPSGPPKTGRGSDVYKARTLIARYLLHSGRPERRQTLVITSKLSETVVLKALASSHFKQEPDGSYVLTESGKTFAKNNPPAGAAA